MDSCLSRTRPPVGTFDRTAPDRTLEHRRDGNFAVRLGLADITGIGQPTAERIVAEREAGGPFLDMADLARRVGLSSAQLESLAAVGAFDSMNLGRRQALWQAGSAAQEKAAYLSGTSVTVQPPLLPELRDGEQVVSDLWGLGLSPEDHPMRHVRDQLTARGVLSAAQLRDAEPDRRIEVGGVVIHRQRPATAGGVTFLNLEDETGVVNIICTVGVWNRYRRIARGAPAMIIRGILERSPEGVTNILADRFEALQVNGKTTVRNFR